MQTYVKEVSALDDFTCQFTFTESHPRFLLFYFSVQMWGMVRIVPKHIWEDKDPMTFKNYDPDQGWPVWTGPYSLTKASPSEFVWDRRDDWWGAKTGFKPLPAPERLIFVEAGDTDRKAAMLEANEVDGQPSLSILTMLTLVERNPNVIGWTEDPPYAWIDACPGGIVFNCEHPIWGDRDIRWAVAYAIDNQKMAELSSGGYGFPARFTFPMYPPLEALLDENADLIEKYDMRTFDPARSRQLIESKGWEMGPDGIYVKDGKPLRVELIGKSMGPEGQIMLSAFLKNVGIDAVPKLMAHTTYYDVRSRGQYEIDSGHSYCGSVFDPWGELNTLHSQWIVPVGEVHSNNRGHFSNPEFDSLTDQIKALVPGDPRIKPLFRKALEIWLRELPAMATAQQLRVVPYSTKYWTNWPTAKNNYFHPPNWHGCFLRVITEIKPA
jgi:peptide/nickel transport system substrate-binding protein